MDNVFEILIYLIIIVSFLSSIFKKKKQQQRPPAQQPQTDEQYQAEVAIPQTQSKEEYDILKELEDFFKVGSEQPQQQIPDQQETPTKVTQVDERTRREMWQSRTESEHYVEDWEGKTAEVKKRMARVDPSVEKKAALFEESLVRKEAVFSSIALIVKSKITNPSTLKEYIIFSEILGKPKALRR
jgi:hypothetical protein